MIDTRKEYAMTTATLTKANHHTPIIRPLDSYIASDHSVRDRNKFHYMDEGMLSDIGMSGNPRASARIRDFYVSPL